MMFPKINFFSLLGLLLLTYSASAADISTDSSFLQKNMDYLEDNFPSDGSKIIAEERIPTSNQKSDLPKPSNEGPSLQDSIELLERNFPSDGSKIQLNVVPHKQETPLSENETPSNVADYDAIIDAQASKDDLLDLLATGEPKFDLNIVTPHQERLNKTACKCILTMEEAERIALANNFTLEQASLRAERDFWTYREVLGRYLPALSYNEIWTRSNMLPDTSFFGGRYVNTNSQIWRVDQLILSLPTYYDIGSADWAQAASFFDYLELLVRTTADIRNAHMRVLTAKMLIAIAQEVLDLFQESYQNDAIRLEVGESTAFEYNRNRLAYTNALSDYYRAMNEYENSKSEWVKLLGWDPSEAYNCDIAETDIPLNDIDFIKAIEGRLAGETTLQVKTDIFHEEEISNWKLIAAFQRPLLKKTDADYRGAEMRVKSTWGTYIPEVRFFSTYNTNTPPEFFTTKRRYQETGVALTWRVFDGLQRESRLMRLRRERELYKSAEIESWYTVQIEIENRTYLLQDALYALRGSEVGYKLAEQGIEYGKELYLQGDITAIDYRDMIQSLGRAKNDLALSRFSLITNYFNLLAALGLQDENSGIYLLKSKCPTVVDDEIDFCE